MLFPESERALESTIDDSVEETIVGFRILRPAACQGPSTTFQSLTRRLNDLHEGSIAYRENLRLRGLFCKVCSIPKRWNPVFNAPRAESGTRLLSTNPQGGGRVTWKTARFAASRMCCAWIMTTLRRNSLLRRNWNEGRPSDLDVSTGKFYSLARCALYLFARCALGISAGSRKDRLQ